MFGTGAANVMPQSVGAGHWHGTHVAGIAAGRDAGTGYSGVARDANLILVKVTRNVNNTGADFSLVDLDQAIDYVYSLKDTYSMRPSI